MTIQEIFRVYVLEPRLKVAMMNRIGRAPKEDEMTIRFLTKLEDEVTGSGVTIPEFRATFLKTAGCYPEYATGEITLTCAQKLCTAFGMSLPEVLRDMNHGEEVQ